MIDQAANDDLRFNFDDSMSHDECVEHFLAMSESEFKQAMDTLSMIADAFNEAAALRRYVGGHLAR